MTKWSYYEKLERLKEKIVAAHKRVELKKVDGKPSSDQIADSKTIEDFKTTDHRQPPHHEWLKVRNESISL